jgi:DNA-directed RNA polymerase subunit M/transcription elongation factor TFIIS
MYIVVNCPSCGELILANTRNKTRTCTKCGNSAKIHTLRVLVKTRDPKDAVKALQRLKARHGDGVTFKKFKVSSQEN